MRRVAVVGLVAVMLLVGCRMYQRAAVGGAIGAGLGYGMVQLFNSGPCPAPNPADCVHSTTSWMIGGALVGLAAWGIYEGVSGQSKMPTPPEPDESSSSPTAPSSPSSVGGGVSISDGPSVSEPRQFNIGGSSDRGLEPELTPVNAHLVYVTAGGFAEQAGSPIVACNAAKRNAFDNLSRCPTIATKTTYLTQWIIHRATCECAGRMNSSFTSCTVKVEGMCDADADAIPQFGSAESSSESLATSIAYGNALARCFYPEIHRAVLGCDTLPPDHDGGDARYACTVEVTCRLR